MVCSGVLLPANSVTHFQLLPLMLLIYSVFMRRPSTTSSTRKAKKSPKFQGINSAMYPTVSIKTTQVTFKSNSPEIEYQVWICTGKPPSTHFLPLFSLLCEPCEWWHHKRVTETDYSLGTSWSPVDFYEPDFQLLINHEVKAKELEALVVKMLCADCRLYTHKAASATGKIET